MRSDDFAKGSNNLSTAYNFSTPLLLNILVAEEKAKLRFINISLEDFKENQLIQD